jgi:hypothetical protein
MLFLINPLAGIIGLIAGFLMLLTTVISGPVPLPFSLPLSTALVILVTF